MLSPPWSRQATSPYGTTWLGLANRPAGHQPPGAAGGTGSRQAPIQGRQPELSRTSLTATSHGDTGGVRRIWALAGSSNSPGVVALLTTPADQPENWIGAGQALQRTLLYATHFGLAAAINSQPLEIPQLRDFMRVQLCDGAHPQMVLRFGVTGDTLASVRRPVEDVLL